MHMHKENELKEIEELRAMAQVYRNHGFAEKADELASLADALTVRVMRLIGTDRGLNKDDRREA